MKKTLFSLMVTLLMSLSVFAQLPKGSVAPDFTVRDLVNNQPYNLYTFLNNGYTVYIDVSAAWCGPCWNYHNQHHLEALYKHHGPTGLPGVDATTTNDVMVFYVEGESTNTHAQLYGTTSGTAHSTFSQGNWIAGTPYPVIDTLESWFDTNYSIHYFPTIYKICRDRLIEEVGQIDSTALYAYVAGCPTNAPTASVDVHNVLANPTQSLFCGTTSTVPVTVQFQNYSTTNLTACSIEARQGATLLSTTPWTGNLASYAVGTSTITLTNITPTTHLNTLTFTCVAAGDANATNNDITTDVKIYAPSNDDALTYTQNFESATAMPDEFGQKVADDFGMFFYYGGTAVTGNTGSASKVIVIDNYNNAANTVGTLIAGNHNTTPTNGTDNILKFSFDVAHAVYTGSEPDKLEVVVSTDCGATWTSKLTLQAPEYNTHAAVGTGQYTPAASADWLHKDVDLSAYLNQQNFLVGFKATSGYGNFGFIDNVVLKSSSNVGINNVDGTNKVEIYPNPSEGNFNVALNLTATQNVKIDVVNMLGQTISSSTTNIKNGVVALDLNDAATGSYFVKITTSNETITKKIVKE